MTRRPRLPAPPTSLMLAIILPALLVWGTLFALLVHPADAQEGSGPAKPTGLTATATHDQVALTWDDPQDDSITGYVILRRVRVNDVGGEFSELVPDTGTAATTYTDDSVAADTTYTYRIKAINGHGESERSRWYHVDTPAPPVPAKPTGLTGAATHETVTLTWDDPDDGSITGYLILRRVRVNDQGGEFGELVSDTGSAATTYTDDTVAAGATYTYRIKAINEHGESERSRWFHVETLELPVPSKPTGLTAEVSHDRVVLAWDDPQDDSITHYRVLRRDWDPTSSFAVIEEDTGSADAAYTDETVASERGYVYRVRAVNAHGASEGSDQARASTPPPPIVVRSSGDEQTLWSATLTAGTATLDGETLVGYSVWNQGTGALSDTAFAVGGRTVTVQVLMVAGSGAEQGLYLGLTERLEGNAALRVGTEEFNLSEAELIRGGNWIYQWSGAGLEWTEGEEVAVSIVAPEPDGSRLRELSLEGMAELPFSPERTRYETRRQAGQQKTTVDAQVEGGTASVLTVRSDVPLAFDAGDADAGKAGHQAQLSARGQTLVVVYATSEDGSRERAYVVRVSEAAGSAAGRRSAARSEADADATLGALELDGFDLDPAFDNETYDYSASVGTNVDTVTVTATATQSGAETLITPADADPDTAGHQVRLAGAQAGGSLAITPIVVVVRSADGSALESYVVTVSRAAPPSSDASLSALSLSGIVLSPAFASDVFIYTAAVAADVEQTTVTATANDLHGDVEIAPGSGGLPEVEITPEDSDPLTPGHQVALNEGENTITVTVTARDGQTTREYVVTVNRAAMPTSDASLAELRLSGLELSPAFDPDTQSYTASAGWDVERVELVARPTDPAATVVISPADTDANTPGWQIALAATEPEGDPAVTNIAIVVTSSDGAARQTYLVQVSRDAPAVFAVSHTFELPEGCKLLDFGASMRVRGRFDGSCASLYPDNAATSGARYYQLFLHSPGRVRLWVDPRASQSQGSFHIVVRDAETGEQLHWDGWRGRDYYKADLTIDNLDAGMYVVELASHYHHWDRIFSMLVEGDTVVPLKEYRLSSLALTGVNLADFESGVIDYARNVAADVATTTVDAVAERADDGATVSIAPGDHDSDAANGHQVVLEEDGLTEITVTVGDSAPGNPLVYRVSLRRLANTTHPLSSDASLSALSLSGLDIGEFSREDTGYSYRLDTLREIIDGVTATVTATKNDPSAAVVISPADADPNTDGHQVVLNGYQTVSIVVTPQDGSAKLTYKVVPHPNGGFVREPDKDIRLTPESLGYGGIWSDGETMWVYNWLTERFYAYDVSTGNPAPDRERNYPDHRWIYHPLGKHAHDWVWPDGELHWRLKGDEREDSIRWRTWLEAYDPDTREFVRLDLVDDPESKHVVTWWPLHGIWSDGATMWLLDPGELFAYSMDTGERALGLGWMRDKFIFATGIWSDARTMYIQEESTIYAYRMPVSARLNNLELSGVDFGMFLSGVTSYEADVANDVAVTTVNATQAFTGGSAGIVIVAADSDPGTPDVVVDADDNTAAYQVNLATGRNIITITVTSPDGADSETYTITVNRAS